MTRVESLARQVRALTAPLLALVVLLGIPGLARGIELGLGAQTSVPLLAGVEAGLGSRHRWEAALGAGLMPDPYVRVIEAFADSQQDSDVLSATLGKGLGLQAHLRIFPATGYGFYVSAGYDLFRVQGTIKVEGTAAELQEALEEPDTGGDLPPTGPPLPPDAGGEEEQVYSKKEDVTSLIHALRLGVGYRHYISAFYLQGELSVTKAIMASSSPDRLDDYLQETYTENLLVPLLTIAMGFRL